MASRYESDMTRKEKMQLEKEKLSKMNFKEKLAYIWEYYKAVIFGIIAVIFIIGTIVNIHENAKYYDLVSIAVVDYAGLQDVSPIEEDLKEALGTGDKYEKVSIDTSYSFGENLENADYNTLMKFTAVIAAQSMDVLICSQAVYDNYSKDDYFLDLSTLFDEATCEKYGIKAGDTCLGVLLNKRKKDPRMAYKLGDRTLFEQNSVHAAFYREYLKEEFRMERYEWESCGDTSTRKFPEGKNSMHLPFYQTNTSQYCPLYAACTEGSRGAQVPIRECPKFCERQAFLYPEHLRMVGRYNSLFGVDLTVLKRTGAMLELRGVDRVVVNLL